MVYIDFGNIYKVMKMAVLDDLKVSISQSGQGYTTSGLADHE